MIDQRVNSCRKGGGERNFHPFSGGNFWGEKLGVEAPFWCERNDDTCTAWVSVPNVFDFLRCHVLWIVFRVRFVCLFSFVFNRCPWVMFEDLSQDLRICAWILAHRPAAWEVVRRKILMPGVIQNSGTLEEHCIKAQLNTTFHQLALIDMGVNPKIGFFCPQIIHFNRVFHEIIHFFGNIHISTTFHQVVFNCLAATRARINKVGGLGSKEHLLKWQHFRLLRFSLLWDSSGEY